MGLTSRHELTDAQADSYKVMVRLLHGKEVPNLVTVSESKLASIKRGINNVFTTNSLLDYEHLIDETQAEFFEALSHKDNLDISLWMQLFTFDVLSRLAFGVPLGTLKHGQDLTGTIKAIEANFIHWNVWGALPALERLLLRNPLSSKLARKSTSGVAQLAAKQLHVRRTATAPPEQRDFLQKYLEASEKYPETFDNSAILGITTSTIAAGADTTAITLTVFLYFLLKTPHAMQKLQAEFDSARSNGTLSHPARWSEVKIMPYLDAAIKEAMRLVPLITFPLERKVPAGGVELAGTFFPAGTTVGASQVAIHYSRDVYGGDADSYNPDRWLEADETRRSAMERAFLGFGAGKRICIGRHIAELKMKKFIPDVLMNCEVFPHLSLLRKSDS